MHSNIVTETDRDTNAGLIESYLASLRRWTAMFPATPGDAIEWERTPAAAISEYAREVLKRATTWAFWLADHAAQRGLPNGEVAWMRVAAILERLRDVIEVGSVPHNVLWIANKAYWCAFHVTEREDGGNYRDAADHQLIEVEESAIRTLLCYVLPQIQDRHWQLIEGFVTPERAQLFAAEDLIASPHYPEQPEE
jgi:hypothetical protein